MTTGPDHTNSRWLSAAFTALPILLSVVYAIVAGGQPKPKSPFETAVATRTP